MPVSDSNRPVSVTLWPPLAIISAVAATFAVVEAVTSVWADRQGSAAWAAKQFSSQADRHAVDAELKEVLVLAGFIFFAALSISFMNAKWRHDRKRAVAFGFGYHNGLGGRSPNKRVTHQRRNDTGSRSEVSSSAAGTRASEVRKSVIGGCQGLLSWLMRPVRVFGAAWPIAELGGWVCGSALLAAGIAGLNGQFPAVFAGALVLATEEHKQPTHEHMRVCVSLAFCFLLMFSGFALWGLRRVVRKRHVASLHIARAAQSASAANSSAGAHAGAQYDDNDSTDTSSPKAQAPSRSWLRQVALHWVTFVGLNIALAIVSGCIAGERLVAAQSGQGGAAGLSAVPAFLIVLACLLSMAALVWLACIMLLPCHDPLFQGILRSLALPVLVLAGVHYAALSGWAHCPMITLPISRQGAYLVTIFAPLVATAHSLASAVHDVAGKEKSFQTLAHEVRGPIQNIRTALVSIRAGLQGRLVASSDLSAAMVLLFTHGNARFITDIMAHETSAALPSTTPSVAMSTSGGSGPSNLRGRAPVRSPISASAYAPVTSVDGRERGGERPLGGAHGGMTPSRHSSTGDQSDLPSVDWHLLSTGGMYSSTLAPSPMAGMSSTSRDELGRGTGTSVPLGTSKATSPSGGDSGTGIGADLSGASHSDQASLTGARKSLGHSSTDGRSSQPARRASAASEMSDLHSLVVIQQGGGGQGGASEEMQLGPLQEATHESLKSIVAPGMADSKSSRPVEDSSQPGHELRVHADAGARAGGVYGSSSGRAGAGMASNRIGAFAGAGSRSMIEGGVAYLAPLNHARAEQRGGGPLLRAMSGGGQPLHVLGGASGKAPPHSGVGGSGPGQGMRKAVTLDSFALEKEAGAAAIYGKGGDTLNVGRSRTGSSRLRGPEHAPHTLGSGVVYSNSTAGGGDDSRVRLPSHHAITAAADALQVAADARRGGGQRRGATDDRHTERLESGGGTSSSARSRTSDTSVLTASRVHRALSQVVRLNRWAATPTFKSILRDRHKKASRITSTNHSVLSGSLSGTVHAGSTLQAQRELSSARDRGRQRTARSTMSSHTPQHHRTHGVPIADLAMASSCARLHLLRPSMELLRSLQEAEVSSRMLLDNLDAQLELARLRSGKQNIPTDVFSLEELLQNLRTSMRQRFADNQVTPEWKACTPGGLSACQWRTSRKRLQQAALNILSNAAKYGRTEGSERGFVTVKAELSDMTLPPEAVTALQQHEKQRKEQQRAAGRMRAPTANDDGLQSTASLGAAGGGSFMSRFFSSLVPDFVIGQAGQAQMTSSSSTELAVASPSLGPVGGAASFLSVADRVAAAFQGMPCASVPDVDGALAAVLGGAVAVALKQHAPKRKTWGGSKAGLPPTGAPPAPPAPPGAKAPPRADGSATHAHSPDLLDDSTGHLEMSVSAPSLASMTPTGVPVPAQGAAGSAADATGAVPPALDTGLEEVPMLKVPAGTRMVFRLSVRDQGMGMTEEEQDKVFQDFHRLHNDNKGTGLGLGVAREAMRLLQGDVWCKSKGKGHGTEFVVELPVVLEAGEQAFGSSSEHDSDSGSDTTASKSPTHATGGAILAATQGGPAAVLRSGSSHGESSDGTGTGVGVVPQPHLPPPGEPSPNNTPPSPGVGLSSDNREISNASAVVQSDAIAPVTSNDESELAVEGAYPMSRGPQDPIPVATRGRAQDDLLSTIEEQSMDGRTVATQSVRGGAGDGTGVNVSNVSTPSDGSHRGGSFSHASGNPQNHSLGTPLGSPVGSFSTGQMQLQPLTGNPAAPSHSRGGFGFTGSMGTTGSVLRHSSSITGGGYGGTEAAASLMMRQSSSASASMGPRMGVGKDPPPGMARQSSSASVAPVHGAKPRGALAPDERLVSRGTYGGMHSRGGSLDVSDDLGSHALPSGMRSPKEDSPGSGASHHRRGQSGDLANIQHSILHDGGRATGVHSDDPGGVIGTGLGGGTGFGGGTGLRRFESTSEYPTHAENTFDDAHATLEHTSESTRHGGQGLLAGVSLASHATTEEAASLGQPTGPMAAIRVPSGGVSASPPGGGDDVCNVPPPTRSGHGGGRAGGIPTSPHLPPRGRAGSSSLRSNSDDTGTGEVLGSVSVPSPSLKGGEGGGSLEPRARGSSEVASIASSAQELKTKHVRLLLVDDDRTLLSQGKRQIRKAPAFAKTAARKYDVHVATAEDGEDAVHMALGGGHDFTHITLDGNMNRMGGVEATVRLREGGYTGVILGITGGDEECEEFLAAGADAALVKPVEWDRVAVTLKKCRRKRESLQ